MIQNIVKILYKYRWSVLLTWIFLLIAAASLGLFIGNGFQSDVKLKNTDSQVAQDIVINYFPNDSGSTGIVVFKARQGINNRVVKSEINSLFSSISSLNNVIRIDTPYAPKHFYQVNKDETIAYGVVQFNQNVTNIDPKTLSAIRNLTSAANTSYLQIDLGGDVFSKYRPQLTSEWIGFSAAALVLLVAFGSVIAMGLTLFNAFMGIGIGISLIGLLAHVMKLPDFAADLAAMLGIGVGIDYALLVITRYRQNLQNSLTPLAAISVALDTAGRSVLFAGVALVASLLAMLITDVEFVQDIGIAASLVVTIMVLASLTLMPAILGLVGRNIDRFKVPSLNRNTLNQNSVWERWSRFLQKSPWSAFILGMSIMVALTIPYFSIQLGSSDSGNHPTSVTTRRAYDLISKGFGVGANGPLLVAVTLNGEKNKAAVQNLQESIAYADDVDSVSPVRYDKNFNAALFQVIPKSSPQSEETKQLMVHIRNQLIPKFTDGTPVKAYVGGITAGFADLAQSLQDSLPLFIGAVLIVSFVLLMLAFRSILIPLKAVIMNLLTIGASYGVVVAVFQWGWLSKFIGVGLPGPIESYVPVIMFAIIFGLSMDYEVFLLSRIKEEYDSTKDNQVSVQRGLAQTAKVISAAAAIMVTVFVSFVVTENRTLKEFGLGLAVAIFLDATVVRLVLVPALMELLGKANWWFPKWLRWLPKFPIDKH